MSEEKITIRDYDAAEFLEVIGVSIPNVHLESIKGMDGNFQGIPCIKS